MGGNYTPPILIVGAMNSETGLLISRMTEVREHRKGDILFAEGKLGDRGVVVCRCLIGTVYSAAATALAIDRYSPGTVINCGTAGAHSPVLHQGDMVLGEKIINAGRFNTPHTDAGEGTNCSCWEFPVRERFEGNGYEYTYHAHSAEELLKAAESTEYPYGKVIRGTVLSSDGWNREIDRILLLHNELGSDCEDMESFAVAKICQHFNVPCLIARVISNNELYPGEQCDFERYGRICQQFIIDLVEKT